MELRLDGALQASTEAERDAEQNTRPLTSPHLDRGAGHDRARHAEPNRTFRMIRSPSALGKTASSRSGTWQSVDSCLENEEAPDDVEGF
ncbi:hypothetical protein [Plantibacter sp. YIM 135347]|uniref:hypothetical protein n=1 Tax=Plantibacter sp. YIM 135347 TaxID=3423919 RepID=UPI003D33EC0F